MTKTQNFVWFLIPLLFMVTITILGMIAIHSSIQMPLLFSSVTWNSDVAKELAGITWNSRVIPLIC